MKKSIIAVVCLSLFGAGSAMAASISFPAGTGQGEFRSASKEVGMGLAYKNVAPPHALGVTGFDAGVEIEAADIKKDSAAFGKNAPSFLVLPKVRVRKGLPFGIDIGAMYSNIGNSNVQLYGVEVSKTILEGGIASPAIGVRGTYTKLAGVKELDLQTAGIDASIGKGILMFTPYAGAGMVWINSKYTGINPANLTLSEEKIWQPRVFAGVEIKPIPFFRIVGEAEYSLRPIYTLKVAVGF